MGGDGILMRALTSHRSGPGTIPGPTSQCHLSFLSAWVCYWFSSLPREFLPESFSFSSSSKINTLNSNSTWKQWTGRATAWNVHCYNYISIVIIIIIIIKFGPKIDLKWELEKREQQKQYHAEIGWSLFWIRAKGNIYPIRGSRSG